MTNHGKDSSNHPQESLLKVLFVPILLALVASGTAPWWWEMISKFSDTDNSPIVDEEVASDHELPKQSTDPIPNPEPPPPLPEPDPEPVPPPGTSNPPNINGSRFELLINNRQEKLEDNFSRENAVRECEQYIQDYNNGQQIIDCKFDGHRLGYELLLNHQRVGYQPGWSLERATQNCLWNIEQHDERGEEGQKVIDCQFDGVRIGYELRFNSERAGYQPGWTREQALDNCLWNVQQYGAETVSCYFNDVQISTKFL
jgi:hypothetical protein